MLKVEHLVVGLIASILTILGVVGIVRIEQFIYDQTHTTPQITIESWGQLIYAPNRHGYPKQCWSNKFDESGCTISLGNFTRVDITDGYWWSPDATFLLTCQMQNSHCHYRIWRVASGNKVVTTFPQSADTHAYWDNTSEHDLIIFESVHENVVGALRYNIIQQDQLNIDNCAGLSFHRSVREAAKQLCLKLEGITPTATIIKTPIPKHTPTLPAGYPVDYYLTLTPASPYP